MVGDIVNILIDMSGCQRQLTPIKARAPHVTERPNSLGQQPKAPIRDGNYRGRHRDKAGRVKFRYLYNLKILTVMNQHVIQLM